MRLSSEKNNPNIQIMLTCAQCPKQPREPTNNSNNKTLIISIGLNAQLVLILEYRYLYSILPLLQVFTSLNLFLCVILEHTKDTFNKMFIK